MSGKIAQPVTVNKISYHPRPAASFEMTIDSSLSLPELARDPIETNPLTPRLFSDEIIDQCPEKHVLFSLRIATLKGQISSRGANPENLDHLWYLCDNRGFD
jgi:hypothetical protein